MRGRGRGDIWEICVPPPQFCHEPKAALKNKVYLSKTLQKEVLMHQKRIASLQRKNKTFQFNSRDKIMSQVSTSKAKIYKNQRWRASGWLSLLKG